jgi:hypothetical protein
VLLQEVKLIAEAIERSVSDLRTKIAAPSDEAAPLSLEDTAKTLELQAALLRDKLKRPSRVRAFFTESKDLLAFGFAALAFVVSSANLLLTFYWVKPDIHAIKGSTVQITYIPKQSELRLDFRITVANYGRRMDVVKWTQGGLSSATPQSPTINFSSRTGDFILKDVSHELAFPLTVAERTAIDINGSVSQVLGTATKSTLFQKAGQAGGSRSYTLNIEFKTVSTRDTSACFLFELQDEVLAEIESGHVKEISTLECGGGR